MLGGLSLSDSEVEVTVMRNPSLIAGTTACRGPSDASDLAEESLSLS